MFYLFVKRIFDIFFGLIGIIFLIPLSMIIKIIYIFNSDYHSIFFTQKRIGKNGKPFTIYKYRTMIPNADIILKELLKNKDFYDEYINSYKIKNDPRITKAGRIMRRLSIDEMPQFINLLIGNMSLIGPRPIIDEELNKYIGNKENFLSIKPGIMGNWACNGRSNISYNERMKLELYYVENIGFKLDVIIFFKSIITIIKKTGAF